MDFETLYNERVEKCSHETAFNKEEARALFNLCYAIPAFSNILEVGVEYGRSTAVLGTVAKDRGHTLTAIDPIITSHVLKHHIVDWQLPINFQEMTSQRAALAASYSPLNLVHIDGDHEYEAVLFDCYAWVPRIVAGGFACFDDYGHPGLEGVKKAVDEFFSRHYYNWLDCGVYGNKLKVYQKIA